MLNVDKLIQSALSCLGWPYVSPGSNNEKGIDCSGLWVKCFRDQGKRIYHGSNTIFREYCTETGKLTNAKQLQPGMAVFKIKPWTDADIGNRWYGKEPGNLSHIGMVTSVNPLVITHATNPVVKQDKTIGRWAYWGKIKDVDYPDQPSAPDPQSTAEKQMRVVAENGRPVNMRRNPSLNAPRIEYVPVGNVVTQDSTNADGWSHIRHNGKTGWMLARFLSPLDKSSAPEKDDKKPTIPVGEKLSVWTENGGPVKMRKEPSTSCGLYDDVQCGETVTLVGVQGDWCQVDYRSRRGWYIMKKFLNIG